MGTLADFAEISCTALQMVVEGTGSGVPPGRMLSAWAALLNNSKAELIAAVLQSVAVVLTQTDEHYATAAHPHSTPFVSDVPSTGTYDFAINSNSNIMLLILFPLFLLPLLLVQMLTRSTSMRMSPTSATSSASAMWWCA